MTPAVLRLLARVRYLLRVVLSKRLYANIAAIFENPTLLDYTLLFTAYGLLLVLETILKLPQYRQAVQVRAGQLRRYVESKLAGHEIKETPRDEVPVQPLPKLLATLAAKLAALYLYIGDVRIFNRMWACIGMIPWGVDLVRDLASLLWRNPDRVVNYLQVFNGIVLQFLENVGFVGDHHFTTQSDELSFWANLWCGRLWALYVVFDIFQLMRVPAGKRDRKWRNYLVYEIANLPLTAHWLVATGLISRQSVGFWGALGAGLRCLDYWPNIAEGC